jgi:mono/diheme cytochrome c family protein
MSRRGVVKGLLITLGFLAAAAGGLVAYVELAWDSPVSRPVVQMSAPRDPDTLARGKYLYEDSMLCWGCHGSLGGHSSGEPQSGGHEFDMTAIGPGFGYVYSRNLTPDAETGIGAWSDAEVVRAIREGLTRTGRVIFPVMAYPFYHRLSDRDALALVAYLRSLPAERRVVPPRRLSFAARALLALAMIRPEPAITGPVVAPARAATVEYGEYVAWAASGCAECHSPRSPRDGSVDASRPLAGGLFPFPEEGFSATGANLTPDVGTGIGRWTEDQFRTALRTGRRPNGTVILPFMPWPRYSLWSDEELQAVWLYLRSLTPFAHAVPAATLTGAAATGTGRPRGGALFAVYCVTCHGENGSSTGPLVTVPLKDMAAQLDDASLAAFIGGGFPGTRMPGFDKTLSQDRIADIVAFIRSWEKPGGRHQPQAP